MKKVLPLIGIALLLFNGISAIYGGGLLMVDPSGGKINLSVQLLKHSPFTDYFIPGLILFIFNGVLSIFCAMAGAMKLPEFPKLIALQGSVLVAWIIIQIALIRTTDPLHFVLGTMGFALAGIGLLLSQHEHNGVRQNDNLL
jgi:hypothetical protein